ncbi:MAG: ABC transporter [Paracoccus denitrificans]|nr:MAG: ABC transporter [Paracoccus denitrificans]PZO85023.1 MAG: ABC transporter [Paracoccus denitrificans]
MFEQRRAHSMLGAVGTTLRLIYNQTSHNLRQRDHNVIMVIAQDVIQSVLLVGMFVAMYWVLGISTSPLRGDHLLFIMTGMGIYLTHTKAVAAAAMASPNNPILQHGPINTTILFVAGALSALYSQVIAMAAILLAYHFFGNPIDIEYPIGALAMFLLAWFYGIAVGLVIVAISPWWPRGATIARQVYQRVNMIASGKMFVANAMPLVLLNMFDWNPLFHIIDQLRGDVFVNYIPRNSNVWHPLIVSLAVLMVGLMLEFFTRKSQSRSWSNRAV